jgi:hypothetical protein
MIVLASGSPRRGEILAKRTRGCFSCVKSLVASTKRLPLDESPLRYIARLACAKALVIEAAGQRIALGADTALVIAGQILGKPPSARTAFGPCARSGAGHTKYRPASARETSAARRRTPPQRASGLRPFPRLRFCGRASEACCWSAGWRIGSEEVRHDRRRSAGASTIPLLLLIKPLHGNHPAGLTRLARHGARISYRCRPTTLAITRDAALARLGTEDR